MSLDRALCPVTTPRTPLRIPAAVCPGCYIVWPALPGYDFDCPCGELFSPGDHQLKDKGWGCMPVGVWAKGLVLG